MIHQIKSYLKHQIGATNQHGVHSPYVYDLVTQCFYDRTQYSEYKLLKAYRKGLLTSKETIDITDFGAGSRVFTSNTRSVSAIAKNAGVTKKRQELLLRLARYQKGNHYLELGTSLGLGTIALALGRPTANITTVEGCSNTAQCAETLFKHHALENICLVNETFESFFGRDLNTPYDLVYVDGNHDGARTLRYFEALQQKIHNDSLLIFDDIYWSQGMTDAWKEICSNPKVTVSIDTFQWGLVSFRKEQEKQHFNIRL